MKKRLLTVLSVILTFLMLGGTFSFAANVPPVSSDKFTDVSANDWYKEYVDFVASNGYMIGTSETAFEPQSDLTRAMFATILARYDKAEVDDSKATIFTDVEVNQWYTGSIGWANENTIVQGYGNGIFGTNDPITRQDLSLMIIRYIRFYEKEHNVEIKVHGGEWNGDITFTDENEIRQDTETPEAIKALVNYGILLGYPDGTVKPTKNITRAEAAAIIKRLDWVLSQKITVIEVDKNGKQVETALIPVSRDQEGNLIAPSYEEAATALGLNKNNITGYKDPVTGITYHAGDVLPPEVLENGLVVLIKSSSGGGGGGTVTPTIPVIEVDENGNPVEKESIPVDRAKDENGNPVTDENGNPVYVAPSFEDAGKALGLNPDDIEAYSYTDPVTGITTLYYPGDVLPSDVLKNGLVVILKSKDEYYYKVDVNVTAPKNQNGSAVAFETPLTAVYSADQAKATNLDKIVEDLISDVTGADAKEYNNKTAITNILQEAIVKKAKDGGPTKFGKYTVTTTADGNIHVDEIDLVNKMEEEADFYANNRMAKVREKSQVNVADGVWKDFVDAFSPANLFTYSGTDLKLKTADEYYNVLKNAVEKSVALHQAIGGKADYERVLAASEAVGENPLGTKFDNQYSVLGKSFDSPTELSTVNSQIAEVLDKGNNDVLIDLCTDAGNKVFTGKENITSVQDVVDVVNKRISRDWSNRDDIQAVLESLTGAYSGEYSIEVVFTKVKK